MGSPGVSNSGNPEGEHSPAEKRLIASISDDGIARVRLNRPDKRNSIDRATVQEFREVVECLSDEDVSVGIISAEAPVFCAGNDLAEVDLHRPFSSAIVELTTLLVESEVLWIAQIEGAVLGGGLSLVAACPLAIASTEATFALPEAKLGILPAAVLPYLEQISGLRSALYLGLTGEPVSGTEARRLGFVSEAVEPSAVEEAAEALAVALDARPAVARAARAAWQSRYSNEVFARRLDQYAEILTANVAELEARDGGQLPGGRPGRLSP
jgi:enoyl-CoA hydratase/carnithine racemase